MDCLIDYIGLNGCDLSERELVINSLPSISLASIDALTTQEKNTYIKVWNDVQLRAAKRYRNDLTRMFSKRFKLKQLKRQIDLGNRLAQGTQSEVEFQGLYFDFMRSADYETYSELALLWVQNIKFYVPTTVAATTATIEIIEVNEDSTLVQNVVYSSTLDASTAGWKTVEVEQGFEIGNYIISVRGLDAYGKLPVVNSWSTQLETCMNAMCSVSCMPRITGATAITNGNNVDVTTTQDTYGVTGQFSIVCSFDKIACNNKKLFAVPFWYLCGAELMFVRLTSERINKWTMNKDAAQELHEYYMAQYQEQLETLIEGITLNTNDACIECNQPYKMVEVKT